MEGKTWKMREQKIKFSSADEKRPVTMTGR